MDEQELLAAAARHDAQALASAVGGHVTSDVQRFLDEIKDAEAREALREADRRSVEQVAEEMGQLYQRFLDARWYGTLEQTRRAAQAFARAMEHPSASRLYVHAAAINIGDYVRAVGFDPHGAPDAATGVVEDVDYTERVVDPYGFGEPDRHLGFAFTLMPVVRADRRFAVDPADIWVRETGSPEVLRLPVPADRGRQPWLDAAAESTNGRAARRSDDPAAAPPPALAKGTTAAANHPAAAAFTRPRPAAGPTTGPSVPPPACGVPHIRSQSR
jgi:hypothetical protein